MITTCDKCKNLLEKPKNQRGPKGNVCQKCQRERAKMKYVFDKKRAMSWSSFSSFHYDNEQWYKKYILNEKEPESKEMAFGKVLAKSLEDGTCTISKLTKELKNKKEHSFSVMFNNIPLVGFADDFDINTFRELNEVKTGKKEWNQKRADEHRQFDFYLLMNFITNKIKPENVFCRLFWLPTQDNGDFSISFVEPLDVHVFETKRTMGDILKLGADIKATWQAMQNYVINKQ